jgi:hypothetical protein
MVLHGLCVPRYMSFPNPEFNCVTGENLIEGARHSARQRLGGKLLIPYIHSNDSNTGTEYSETCLKRFV